MHTDGVPRVMGPTFEGNSRFTVIRPLGEGATSLVYMVRDEAHGGRVVALKTLRHLDPSSLYRLKQEFRALSHFDHPNLVSFYELVHVDDWWFVTMELVDGVDFIAWVRGWDRPLGELPDLVRLRSALRQLADAVATLHAAGRIHRDIKPTNVKVTPAGRVVLLDFGLVAEVDQDYTEGTVAEQIAGSAAYMSPEQSVGLKLDDASDWYSVGVMLYESLTGVWPFTGTLYEILNQKQERDPIPPSAHVRMIPPDLDKLAMDLLTRDPAGRLPGAQVLARLDSRQAGLDTAGVARFRFRNEQVRVLLKALQAARSGRPALALIRGPSGIGRTALLREFVKLVHRSERLITLKSACQRWENLPYKALDGIIDNITRVLRRVDPVSLRSLPTGDLPALARFFPVLVRVDALDIVPEEDAPDVGARATQALVALLTGLARRGPVLLAIDDVHHGDTESADMLVHLLSQRSLPLLVVLTTRTEQATTPFLTWLLPVVQRSAVPHFVCELEPLTVEQSAVVAADLLGVAADDPRATQVAVASGGVPGRIRALALGASGRAMPNVEVTRQTMQTIEALPPIARDVLIVLVVAGGPTPQPVVVAAAGLRAERDEVLATLRALQLIRTVPAEPEVLVDLIDERLREVLHDRLPESTLKRSHLVLAQVLQAHGVGASRTLVHHYTEGGEHARAGVIAWLAADDAARQRRFEASVWFLEQALALGTWSDTERRQLQAQLGDGLALAGRGVAASRAYLDAMRDAPRPRVAGLLRLAVEQQLTSGQVDEALPTLDTLLQDVGVGGLPRGGVIGGAVTGLLRLRQRWRGDALSSVGGGEGAAALHRADVLFTACGAGGLVDPYVADQLQAQHLQAARDCGDPERVVRALSLEAVVAARRGPAGAWQGAHDRARELAQRESSYAGLGRVTLARAVGLYCDGAFAESATLAVDAARILRLHAAGAGWERFWMRWQAAHARLLQGDLREAADLVTALAEDVRTADNALFIHLIEASVVSWLRLAQDQRLDAAALPAPPAAPSRRLSTVEVWLHVAHALVDCASGRAVSAWARLHDGWGPIEATAAYDPVLAHAAWLARARCAVAAAIQGGDAARLVKEADASLGRARKALRPWSTPWILLAEAGAAAVTGRRPDAVLASAEAAFASAGHGLGVALVRRLVGDPDAERQLVEAGVVSPGRFTSMVAPGLT